MNDGADLEIPVVYLGADDFHFAWSGDEPSSVISYLWPEPAFSQFDLDAFDRWMTMRYVNVANILLADVLALPLASQHFDARRGADVLARQAVGGAGAGQYELAHHLARRAYDEVWSVARTLGVPLDQAQGWPAEYRGSFDNAPLLRSGGRAHEDLPWNARDFHPTSLDPLLAGAQLITPG